MFQPTTTARQSTFSKVQTEKHSQNILAGQDRTTRKGQSGKEQERQPGRDRREGQAGKHGQETSVRLDSLNWTARTGQDSQEKISTLPEGFFLPGDNCERSHFFLYICRNSLAKNLFEAQLILKTPSAAHFHIYCLLISILYPLAAPPRSLFNGAKEFNTFTGSRMDVFILLHSSKLFAYSSSASFKLIVLPFSKKSANFWEFFF